MLRARRAALRAREKKVRFMIGLYLPPTLNADYCLTEFRSHATELLPVERAVTLKRAWSRVLNPHCSRSN